MKSLALVVVIFCTCCVWSAVVGQEKCSIGVSSETATNPVLRQLHLNRASENVLKALRAGLLKPSQKYWNEILCLESASSGRSSIQAADPTAFNTAEALQRILRDYVAFYRANGYPFWYSSYRTVLDFLQATNQPETVYAFLVGELKENDYVLEQNLIFDTVLSIKEQFGLGQDSPLLKGVPKAVQLIALQGKQIKLRNNVTGKYLMLSSDFVNNGLNTYTLSDQAINAEVNSSNGARAVAVTPTMWDFKPVKMPSPTPTSPYGRDVNLYTFELHQHGPCPNPSPNCSAGEMLTVRGFSRPQTYDSSQYNGGQRFRAANFSQFTFLAVSEDVVSIQLYMDRVYEKNVLAELPDGSVGVVIRGNTVIDGQPITGLKSYWTVEV